MPRSDCGICTEREKNNNTAGRCAELNHGTEKRKVRPLPASAHQIKQITNASSCEESKSCNGHGSEFQESPRPAALCPYFFVRMPQVRVSASSGLC